MCLSLSLTCLTVGPNSKFQASPIARSPKKSGETECSITAPRVSLFCVRLYVAAGSRAYYLFKNSKWRGFTIDTTLILEDRTGHKICIGGLGDRTGELVISLLQELVSGGAGDAIEDGVTLIISPAMA